MFRHSVLDQEIVLQSMLYTTKSHTYRKHAEASRHVNADQGHSNNTNTSASIPDFTMGFKRLTKLAGNASGVHRLPDLSLLMLVPMPCGTQTESWPVFGL